MEKPNSLQKIYNANRPENNELYRAIQQHLQMKHPDKRMTATRTLQYIVADIVLSESCVMLKVGFYIVEILRSFDMNLENYITQEVCYQ
ncbi:hypothetical protein ACWF7H_23770 [Peribacillus butanolivorans]